MFIWPGPAPTPPGISIESIREWNLQPGNIGLTANHVLILLGSLIACAIIAMVLRNPPKESLWIGLFTIPPLIAIWLYYALLWEVRVLVPVAVLLLPISLSAVFGRPTKSEGVETSQSF